MKYKEVYIKEYELHIRFGPKEPVMLTQEQGERLQIALAHRSSAQFFKVGNHFVNRSDIVDIVAKDKWTTREDKRGIGQRVRVRRELTPSEQVVHERYLRLETERDLLPEPK